MLNEKPQNPGKKRRKNGTDASNDVDLLNLNKNSQPSTVSRMAIEPQYDKMSGWGRRTFIAIFYQKFN